ncbi:MAG: protein-glutamate O-methyltransferase CheR [Pseudomonadota bacterium]
MRESTFNELADLAQRVTGQHFAPSKAYLMEARLSAISRRENFATLDDLVHCLKARPNPRFEQEVAAALTNKRTRFFREKDLLDQIVSHALPQRLKLSNSGRLRVWCAGAGTGQEAWSIAMRIHEDVGSPLAKADIEIIGTDVSANSVEAAKQGVYGHFDVQKGLSIHRLMTHFNRQESGDWAIADKFQEMVHFRRHNLMHPAQDLGLFDVILCGNVLDSLTKTARQDVIENMARQLLPDAYLFVAPTESLESAAPAIKPSREMRGAYVKDTPGKKTAAA